MKRILIYLITLLILSAFQSCADETVLETDSGGRDILIHLNMGGGKSSTRAMSTAQEDYVDETSLAIFAFEKEGTGYTYAYRPQIKSADIANNTMRVVCKTSQKEQLFLIVANAASEVAKVVPQPGETFESISSRLIFERATPWPAGQQKLDDQGNVIVGETEAIVPIPMSAIIKETITAGRTEPIGTAENPHYLVRMLAKLDMNLAEAVSQAYSLEEVYLYRPGKRGYIVYNPEEVYWDATAIPRPRVKRAYAPAVSIVDDYRQDKYKYVTGSLSEKRSLTHSIYGFETVATHDRLKTTALVVGLLKTGNPPTAMQYYRIDIKKDYKNEEIAAFSADLLRNFHYSITINRVDEKSTGKKDPDTAYLGELEYALDVSINSWGYQGIPTEL